MSQASGPSHHLFPLVSRRVFIRSELEREKNMLGFGRENAGVEDDLSPGPEALNR